MSEQMGWREAIVDVLGSHTEAMHYTEIADEIIDRGLKTTVGATPANSVNVIISNSLRDDGLDSPFDRTARGYYRLKAHDVPSTSQAQQTDDDGGLPPSLDTPSEEAKETTGLINALGMHWSREKVYWSNSTPKLLGRQAAGSEPVDFTDQRGVYLLYDRNSVIYVGRATDQGIGSRLKQHTVDRLSSRWDRFSWFGVFSVLESGKLDSGATNYDRAVLIATMEALLIESVEPPQNRRRGDDFRAVEFLQAEDPEIELSRMRALMTQMQAKLGI